MKRLMPLLLLGALACDNSSSSSTPSPSNLAAKENEEIVVVKITGMS